MKIDNNKFVSFYIKFIYTKNISPANLKFAYDNYDSAAEYVDKAKPNLGVMYPKSRDKYIANIIQKRYETEHEDQIHEHYSQLRQILLQEIESFKDDNNSNKSE